MRERLESQQRCTPEAMDAGFAGVEASYGASPFVPNCTPDSLRPHTAYLRSVDSNHRRLYAWHGGKPLVAFSSGAGAGVEVVQQVAA